MIKIIFSYALISGILLEVLFRIISSSNHKEVDIKIYTTPPPKDYFEIYFLSDISFGRVKETSQGDVSFRHPKLML